MKQVFGQPSKIHKIMIDIIVVHIALSNIYPLHVYRLHYTYIALCVVHTSLSILNQYGYGRMKPVSNLKVVLTVLTSPYFMKGMIWTLSQIMSLAILTSVSTPLSLVRLLNVSLTISPG